MDGNPQAASERETPDERQAEGDQAGHLYAARPEDATWTTDRARSARFIVVPHSSLAEAWSHFSGQLLRCRASVVDRWLCQSLLPVNSEEELLAIRDKAIEAGLEVHLVTDSGKTEFHGEPTNTCLAIGPDLVEKIDPVTGDLELLQVQALTVQGSVHDK